MLQDLADVRLVWRHDRPPRRHVVEDLQRRGIRHHLGLQRDVEAGHMPGHRVVLHQPGEVHPRPQPKFGCQRLQILANRPVADHFQRDCRALIGRHGPQHGIQPMPGAHEANEAQHHRRRGPGRGLCGEPLQYHPVGDHLDPVARHAGCGDHVAQHPGYRQYPVRRPPHRLLGPMRHAPQPQPGMRDALLRQRRVHLQQVRHPQLAREPFARQVIQVVALIDRLRAKCLGGPPQREIGGDVVGKFRDLPQRTRQQPAQPGHNPAFAAEAGGRVVGRPHHHHLMPGIAQGGDQFLDMNALPVARLDAVAVENAHGVPSAPRRRLGLRTEQTPVRRERYDNTGQPRPGGGSRSLGRGALAHGRCLPGRRGGGKEV